MRIMNSIRQIYLVRFLLHYRRSACDLHHHFSHRF